MASSSKILVVEDEPDLRQIYRMLLEREGYQVFCAKSAVEGLSEIERSSPDLLVSDLRMPGMSGYKFLSIVRRCYPNIPVVVISGKFSGFEIPKRIIADAFFPRAGFTAQQLFERIDLLLHEPSARCPREFCMASAEL